MAKIAIDAGHGLYTSGKRCLKALDANETREWVLNDRIADELGRLLKAAGHQVLRVDDTDGSNDVSLATRVKRANEWKADFYISVHHNALGTGKIFTGGGTEVYVYKSNPSATSIKAQNAIYKRAMQRAKLPGDNRADGTRSENFYVVRYTNMPACLIECGFMDSSKDIKYILDIEWSKKMALGIAEGICDVFGGKIDTSTTVKEQTTVTTTKKEETVKKPAKLEEDGSWGKKTTYAAQYVFGTYYDGIVSRQPVANKKILISIYDGWEFKEKAADYKNGSSVIKAIQKLTGAEQDGLFGKESIKALQKFLKKNKYYTGLISGKLNKATTLGFQKYLNKRMSY